MLRQFYDDGGRYEAGFERPARLGDCFVRAVSAASDGDYHAVHGEASFFGRLFGKDADYGVPMQFAGRLMRRRGFRKMKRVPRSLDDPLFRSGRYVVFVRIKGLHLFGFLPIGHAFAVVDGAIRDTSDPRRMGEGLVIKQVWAKE